MSAKSPIPSTSEAIEFLMGLPPVGDIFFYF